MREREREREREENEKNEFYLIKLNKIHYNVFKVLSTTQIEHSRITIALNRFITNCNLYFVNSGVTAWMD